MDRLATTGLPIQITEVSFKTNDPEKQAQALVDFYTTAFAHPAVEAFMLWGFWENAHWLRGDAALVTADWTLKPAAIAMQRLIQRDWHTQVSSRTSSEGAIAFRGFHGDYIITVTDSEGKIWSTEVSLSPNARQQVINTF